VEHYVILIANLILREMDQYVGVFVHTKNIEYILGMEEEQGI
jgi:hypothetical protein